MLFLAVGYPAVTLGLFGALFLRCLPCLWAAVAILAATGAYVIYPTIH